MQVLKKFCLLFCCWVVVACASTKVVDEGGADSFSTDVEEIGISDVASFRTAMLLPLSGDDAKYGQGLKNASMIALQELNNPSLVLQYYDTQSTPAGARIAVQNAINQGADLIVGPLKSAEVQAISSDTIYRGVPVIAFSTALEVLQPTVYTLGLLIEEQVDRVVSYAAKEGRKRFALLLPDNATGGAVARAAVKSAAKNGVRITAVGFYTPGISNFSQIAKDMTNYEKRHAKVMGIKNILQQRADAGDMRAAADLKKLATREGLGDVGFDALLVPESGAKLTAALSMFAYYDAAFPNVLFLGTSVWDASRLNGEAVAAKSVYPAVAKDSNQGFAGQYYEVFGEKPSSLYTLAYDAVSVANSLAARSGININDDITTVSGFDGVGGKVRFFADGTNQHSLDIVQVLPSGNVVIDNGAKYFETVSETLPLVEIDANYRAPKIFGKDATAAQILIYGETLPVENLEEGVVDADTNATIVTEQLKAMGIYIN